MARILVVDDDDEIRLVFRLLLEAEGYEVLDAPSGALALEASAASRPALVITDLRLPGMNGCDLLQALAAGQPGLRALIVSGSGPEAVFEAAVRLNRAGARLGVLEFLQKPVLVGALLEVVARVLAKEVP